MAISKIAMRIFDSALGRLRHFRFKLLQFRKHDVSAENEIAGIPEVAFGDKFFGVGLVRLFDETFNFTDLGRVADRRPGVDIAITGCRVVRHHAKCDDQSFCRGKAGFAA